MERRKCTCFDTFVCDTCGYVPEFMTTYKEEHNPNQLIDVYDLKCKNCKRGNYVEAVYCCDCEQPVNPDECYTIWSLKGDYMICKECLENYAIPEFAIEFGETFMINRSINGYFSSALTDEEINEALMEYMKNHSEKFVGKAKRFCLKEEPEEFADFIVSNDKEV